VAELKTKPTNASVERFLARVTPAQTRDDCHALVDFMRKITKSEPVMWGPSVVGFGSYHYRYESGREGDWFLTGFSPRKQNLTIYVMSGFPRHAELVKALGVHRTGKSCLYVKRLDDLHRPTLQKLIRESVKYLSAMSKGRQSGSRRKGVRHG
jgi:hypothetical protein